MNAHTPMSARELEALATDIEHADEATMTDPGVAEQHIAIAKRMLGEARRLQRILAAIAIVHQHHNLGDAVYDVRSRHGGDDVDGQPYTGNSWNHPIVEAYGAAVETLRTEGAIAEPEPPAFLQGHGIASIRSEQ